MRVFRLWSVLITVWWWRKADKRQKKPTDGIGFIIERRDAP